MLKVLAGSLVAITFATGAALAQSPAPGTPATSPAPAATTAPAAKPAMPAPAVTSTPAAKPATTAPTVTLDAAHETRFKGLDKNNNGTLDGAEVASFKNDMAKIDTDKDGKISRAEFAAAVKGGLIK